MSGYAAYLADHQDRHLEELKDFLRIPSISGLPAHRDDVARAAAWLAARLADLGFGRAEVMATAGHPVVYGEWLGAPGAPTVLVYGHYDVQPVDPLHLWQTPPFQPAVRDGRLYARGASDDKGQVLMHLKAAEALLQTEGRLPVNLKVLIEGEEEVGSPSLGQFIAAHRDLLQADVVVISDSPMFGPGQPALCYGLRGLAVLEIHVEGPRSDLHSGMYGGAVQNPVHALTALLSSMRGGDGRILVEGFYDPVRPLTAAERQAFAALPFDEEAYRRHLGVDALWGEAGYSALERAWARPTLEVNGIWGGFAGEGPKTIVPAAAHAKVTCRLVPDQEPAAVVTAIARHVQRHCPPGVRATVDGFPGGRAWVTPLEHPAVQAAMAALQEAFGREPLLTRMGGSIPVVETLDRLLGAPVVLMGFGLPDENFHAPNEHFDLGNFATGMRALCAYWHRLAKE